MVPQFDNGWGSQGYGKPWKIAPITILEGDGNSTNPDSEKAKYWIKLVNDGRAQLPFTGYEVIITTINGSQIGKGNWSQEDAGDTLGETYFPAHSAKIPQDGIVVEIKDKYSQIDVIPHTNGGTNPTPGPALAQSSLTPITVLQPTPTPPPTKTTYTNPAFGYSIEHPYD